MLYRWNAPGKLRMHAISQIAYTLRRTKLPSLEEALSRFRIQEAMTRIAALTGNCVLTALS